MMMMMMIEKQLDIRVAEAAQKRREKKTTRGKIDESTKQKRKREKQQQEIDKISKFGRRARAHTHTVQHSTQQHIVHTGAQSATKRRRCMPLRYDHEHEHTHSEIRSLFANQLST